MGRHFVRIPSRGGIRFSGRKHLHRRQSLLYTLDSGQSTYQSPQVSSPAAIDAEIAEAENSLASKAELFIGGHGGAAQRDAVEFKIAYLNKMKEVFEDNRTAQTFVNAMKEAFPSLPGETGLEELGKALYK